MTKFSIIIVCLNAGDKLSDTVDSVLCQTYENWEIVVKDGGSSDGSVEHLKNKVGEDARIRYVTEQDTGIYDAMNQAVAHAAGEFVFFLNCGDYFADERVLERTAVFCEQANTVEKSGTPEKYVFYGDIYNRKNQVQVTSPPKITGLTCYRNVPCHQACFYSVSLCRDKHFVPAFRVRADYEHFLWCYYKAGAKMQYMGFTVASYEGGGFSETPQSRRRNREEHREITGLYMSHGELLRYKAFMWVTLAPLRTVLAESKWFAGLYQGLVKVIYRK